MKRINIYLVIAIISLNCGLLNAETMLYGLEIPLTIETQVDGEEQNLKEDTALYIERQKRFKPYRDALRKSERDSAIEQYRHEKFPQFPPELITQERHTNYEYDKARKSALWEVESVIKSIDIDPLNPQVHVIEGSIGEPTTLVFLDQTGAPWPILKADDGKSDRMKATTEKEFKDTNRVSIILEDNFVEGNILVHLVDYGVPIVIRIVANPTRTTPYATVRIHRLGPKSERSFTSTGPMDISSCRDVYELLENGSVPSSKRQKLSGISGDVFVTDDTTFVRSKYRLVFPRNVCSTSDGNGNYAAKINSVGNYTATFVMEDFTYETVRIVDYVIGELHVR